MRRFLHTLIAILFISSAQAQADDETPYVPGEFIIMLHEGTKPDMLEQNYGYTRMGPTGFKHLRVLSELSNIHLFAFDEATVDGAQLLRNVRGNRSVRAAQFNHYVEQRSTIPNDPSFSSQWHHNNIQSALAWDITTGGTTANGDEIVVAVIESANYNHNDLIDNHWVNTAEIPGNGIDDDGNGFVDDYHGWNPGGNNDDVCCGGHGTAVNGMVGAKGNNGIGGVGVNWDVKIMNVRVGSLTESNVIAAYEYPYVMRNLYNNTNGAEGAFVVASNASWGIDNANPANYPVWCNYYDDLGSVGILNCGATANNNVNIDVVGDMPTGCGSDYMVAVTATNSSDQRTFSAYGQTTIDLAAPGASVLLPSGSSGYSNTSGTSFASPCVAGGIALVYSAPCETLAGLALSDPQAAADAVIGYIYDGVDQIPQLANETVTGGRLNVFNALNNALDNCGPPPVCEPLAIDVSADCVFNPNSGTAEVELTVGASFESNLCNATQVCYRIGDNNPVCIDLSTSGGSLNNNEDFVITGLQSSTSYSVYYVAADGISPTQVITTPACDQEVLGCTDPTALNFNPAATIDNGSCDFPCSDVTLTITTDCWGGEVSWDIVDGNGSIIASVPSGTYGNQETYTWSSCLDPGCYTFNIYDSFGDGMNGSAYSFCGVDGNYFIEEDGEDEPLVVMTQANYGSQATHEFCIEGNEPGAPPCQNPYPAVQNLDRSVQSNGVQLNWTPIEGSLGCQIQGGLANATGLQTVDVLQADLGSFFIPQGQLTANNQIYRVRVRCGCSQNPLVVGPWTDWVYFYWSNGSSNLAERDLDMEAHFDFSVFPNPNNGEFQVLVESSTEGPIFVRIFDMLGKQVYSTRKEAVAGSNNYPLDLRSLDQAIYLIHIEGPDGEVKSERIVVSK